MPSCTHTDLCNERLFTTYPLQSYMETQEKIKYLWLARYTVHALRMHQKKFRYSRKFNLISEQITYMTLGSRPPNNPIPRSSATEIPVAAPALTTTITDDSMRPTMGDLKAKQYSQSLVCSDAAYVKKRMVTMSYR